MDWIRLFPLVLGSALIIAGTAICWHVIRVTSSYPNGAAQSAASYGAIGFFYAAIAGWLFWLSGLQDTKGKLVWSYLFYGLLFYVAVMGEFNILTLDDLRFAESRSAVAFVSNSGAVILDSQSNIKKALGGTILNYIGIIFVAITVHGPFELRCSLASNFGTFLYLGSIVCAVIGVIILWNLQAVNHTVGNATVRAAVFNGITVPTCAILVILFGSVFCERPDGAYFSAGLLAIWGLWYLQFGFIIKESLSGSDADRGWAGSLFCWFSAWAALIACRFVAVHHVVLIIAKPLQAQQQYQ